MTPEETVARGHSAQRLLADPLLTEGFELVRLAILSKIEEAPIRDRDGVHELKLMLKLLRDVRGNFEHAVQTGKLVEFRIQQEQQEKKRRFFQFGNP